MKNFEASFEFWGLHPALTQSLAKMEYTTPTPIQMQAIPLALKGRDIMGSAQTGTGKTAAFAIPLIESLLKSPKGSALVLTPTRELGKQIMEIMHQLLGRESKINTAFLIGGEPMNKQFLQLKKQPRLIVGTPGRINDHLDRGSLKLNDTGFLVLDETDRMLDMGFSVQIDRIVKHLPQKRQTLMFSATLPKNIIEMSKQYLTNPERISVGSTINPAKNIKQEIIRVENEDKYSELVRQLEERQGSIILFMKTKYSTEKMVKKLRQENLSADCIHGDLRQNRRERVIREFRNMKFRILVATDVASRGLDIPHIEHVINYDLPQVPEDYIHRIGRTARAGAEGSSLCLISPQDGRKWYAIELLMNPNKKPAAVHKKNIRKKPKRNFEKNSESKFQGKPQSKSGKKPNSRWKSMKDGAKTSPDKNGKKRFYGNKKRRAAA